MKITFVRHTSVDVGKGICYGQTDVAVRDTFAQEAAAVDLNLRAIVAKEGAFDAVFRSPLSRCGLLADFCGYSDSKTDPRLLEMNFGEWEMMNYAESTDPRLQGWYDDWYNVPAPGGESFADQNRRVRSFIEEMKNSSYLRVLVFAHAGIIMNAMLIAGAVTLDKMFASQPPYGGIVTLEY